MMNKKDAVLKEMQLAPEWQDDMRMMSLFSSMPSLRDVNPSSWDDKLNFWRKQIAHLVHRGLLSSHQSSLCLQLGLLFKLFYCYGDLIIML
jgi:hypothetical protein